MNQRRQGVTAPRARSWRGERVGVAALVAAALEGRAITRVTVHNGLGSLKQLIESDVSVIESPELFCFGLLETLDIKQLIALSAPRRVTFLNASERARAEFRCLPDFYALWGARFSPVAQAR